MTKNATVFSGARHPVMAPRHVEQVVTTVIELDFETDPTRPREAGSVVVSRDILGGDRTSVFDTRANLDSPRDPLVLLRQPVGATQQLLASVRGNVRRSRLLVAGALTTFALGAGALAFGSRAERSEVVAPPPFAAPLPPLLIAAPQPPPLEPVVVPPPDTAKPARQPARTPAPPVDVLRARE